MANADGCGPSITGSIPVPPPNRRIRMPDISMCLNEECPQRYECYRHEAKPSEYQAYGDFKFDNDNGCEHFWQYKNLPEYTNSDIITGGHPMFHELLEEMREIHNRKNADYGNGKQLGNFEEAKDFGVTAFQGVLVRISDKYSRIKSLSKRENNEGEVKDESIEDTLLDLANYAILAIIVRREEKL